jgi:hypothetical protein
MNGLHKPYDELVARSAQELSRSEHAIKRILQELMTFRKQTHVPGTWKQCPFCNQRETPSGGTIWQLMAKSSEANKNVVEESLRRRNFAATVLISQGTVKEV